MHASRRMLLLVVALLLPGTGMSSLLAEEPRPESTPAYWLAKAEGLAKRIEHPEGRAALLVSIGTGWVEAGENERAKPLLASAVRYARRCRGCISKARRLAEVGLLQHRAGDDEGAAETFLVAREAVNELDGAARIQARAYLAQLWHAAGNEAQARGLLAKSTKAAGMLKDFERAEALAAIADAEAALGNDKQAAHVRELLARAVAALGPDARPILDASLLLAATAEMAADRLDPAEALVAEVEDLSLAVSGYASLARKDHEAGDAEGAVLLLQKALALTPAIEDRVERVGAYAEVARAAWAVGADVQVRIARNGIEKTSKEIEDLEKRIAATILWVDTFRLAGDVLSRYAALPELERLLDEADPADTRTQDLRVRLARVEARAGRFAQAAEGLAKVADPVRRARAQLDLAEALRADGKTEEALARVSGVLAEAASWGEDRRSDRDELLRQAAVLQAACGRLDAAVKTVDAIVSPFHAATACTYVARDLG